MAANCEGADTALKVSVPKTASFSKISIKLFGTAKYPTLHPPAPAHLLKLLLTIVFS